MPDVGVADQAADVDVPLWAANSLSTTPVGGSLLWARSFYDEPLAGAVVGGERLSDAGTGFGP